MTQPSSYYETPPLYYDINDFAANMSLARPLDIVNTANVMDTINAVHREALGVVAIVLNRQGVEYFQHLASSQMPNLTSPKATQIERSKLGHIGTWFNIPVFTEAFDNIPESSQRFKQSCVFTGIDGVLSIAPTPKEVLTVVDPLPAVNTLPHDLDPGFDQTLLIEEKIRKLTSGVDGLARRSLRDKIHLAVSAEVRSQLKSETFAYVDSKAYDMQVFNIEPLVDSILNVIAGPPVLPTTATTRGTLTLPLTLAVVPNIPHHAQNLDQLQTELAWWTEMESIASGPASSADAYTNKQSCIRWIARRQAENVADSPQL